MAIRYDGEGLEEEISKQAPAGGFDSTAVIPLRRWTHVAYVLKGGAALSLYINGVKDCPMVSATRRGAGCPAGGATFAWDEGDVKHNTGPVYVGADPFMQGASMFLDGLKIYNVALPEVDIVLEANDALGILGSHFLRLGCSNCTRSELQLACAEVDEYHPCLCQELMGGGLVAARLAGGLVAALVCGGTDLGSAGAGTVRGDGGCVTSCGRTARWR